MLLVVLCSSLIVPHLVFLAQNSLFDIASSTLLLLLLFFTWHYLLNVPCSCCRYSCCSLFGTSCSLAPCWCCYCLMLLLIWWYCCYCCSSWCFLLDVATLVAPCLMSLLLLLFDVVAPLHAPCLTPLILLLFLLFDLAAILFVCSQCDLLRYLYGMSWCCYSLLLVQRCCSCSLFQIGISPLSFLWVLEELSKFKFYMLDLESEIFFQSLFVDFFIIHVFGKFRLTMSLFVVCRNYLDILKVMLLCEPQQIWFLQSTIYMESHFYTLHCVFFQHIASILVFSQLVVNI